MTYSDPEDELLHRLDPDWDDVPADLAAAEGLNLTVDGQQGELLIVPALFGHARRLRDGTAIARGPGEVDHDPAAWLRPWNQNGHHPDEDEESP